MDTFAIAAHVQFISSQGIHGPGHALSDYLLHKNIRHTFLQFDLSGSGPTYVVDTASALERKERKTMAMRYPLPFRVLWELSVAVRTLYRIRPDCYIGIDPLNAFYGIVARWLGFVDRVVYYTADYATQRFSNFFLNRTYHAIDRFCLQQADAIWNVSSRITALRTRQGVSSDRNYFVPNAPPFNGVPRKALETIRRYDLVVVANLIPAIDYSSIIEAIDRLRQRFPNMRLHIIGDGPTRPQLEELIDKKRLHTIVNLLGRKNHKEVLDIVSQCAIGLAPYTRDCSWTEFGDSKKAREYLACGLPVIMTRVVSTADDIEKYEAGITIDLTQSDLVDALRSLLGDDATWLRMRENALRVAQEYDLWPILDNIFAAMKLSV